jgi:signal transduction histidine kinase/ligand-binding sensor domain-containing protein
MPQRPPFIKTAISFLLCILPLFISTAVSAQYQFNSWSTDNGLPQNSIYALLQSRDGYLWLTTSDGLVRFDGVRFTVFERETTKGLDSNRLMALFEDREGALWIGTEDRGILRYKGGIFTSYTTKDGLLPSQATSFTEDKDGKLLVRMSDAILERRGEKFFPYAFEYDIRPAPGFASISSANYSSLSFFDRNGVHRYENGRYKTYRVGTGEERPRGVYQDQQENIWISTTAKRFYRLKADSSTIEEIEVKGGLPGIYVESVWDDRQGSIWLSIGSVGLSRLQDGSLTTYGAGEGFAGKRAGRMYEDREGNVWLGTFNEGLYQMSRQTISSYTEQDGLSTNIVYTMYEDHEGTVWIGTWGSGLSSFRDGKFTNHVELKSITSSHITAIFEDSEKSLWVGAHNFGLSRLKEGKWTSFKRRDGLSNDSIFAVQQDRVGALWIGTARGLNRYKEGVFTAFTTEDGLAHGRVQAIHEDRAGNLWLGTLGGVSRFKDGVFTNITEREGLSSNHVRSIYEDLEGAIWIGTYDSGLNRLKDGKITRYTTREGLYNNGVFQILEDARGYFWMSCNRGIYRVSRRELNDFAEGKIQSITSVSFDKRDGMPSSECNGGYQPAGIKLRAGRLLFPTQGGIAVVDPDMVRAITKPPPVVLEDLIVDRQRVALRDKIEISPGQDNLEIQYTGLSFIKPQLIRFKYRLAGLDDDWVDAGTRRTAYYSYLPPGEYTFTVIAANSDGVWNTEGAAIKVFVYPPFWRTRWFLALSSLSIFAIAFLIYKRRVRSLKRAQAKQESFSRQLIESQEAERKRIAAELHDSLGQELLIIKNRTLLSLAAPKDQQKALEQMNEISQTASQVIEEVRAIAHDLRPYQLDRLGLTKAIESIFKKVADSSDIKFRTMIDPIDGLFSKESEINIYRIVQESVNNIVKHSGATEAHVTIERDSRGVQLRIEDNGKGFNPEAASGESGKRGFGLTGISERARMLGGKQIIQSSPGEGTIITLKIGLQNGRHEN